MNKHIALLAVFVIFAPLVANSAVNADSLNHRLQLSSHDRLFAQDKGHHFMASAFLTGFSFYAFHQEMGQSRTVSNRAAIGTVFSIGLAKEIYDGMSGKGTPSYKDMLANIVGIVVGIAILNISAE